jgi:hypothetical protein
MFDKSKKLTNNSNNSTELIDDSTKPYRSKDKTLLVNQQTTLVSTKTKGANNNLDSSKAIKELAIKTRHPRRLKGSKNKT